MSRLKAFIFSALLMIVIFTLLFATIQVNSAHDISLFHVTTSVITGLWISDKVLAFYKWLRNDMCLKKCEKCLNSRTIVLENGCHAVCSLPRKQAVDCMTGKKNRFIHRKGGMGCGL